ncbi:MAG: DUF4349 domain-containing protein, partial [Planctomycetes bacterium]|nr:DUF4349 domain-containing protein [Planctomycetota bacterium]
LRDLVAAEKGFIAGADTQRLANGKIRATVTVRVSPDRFEATLAKLRELGTVRHQSISTQDVTKAYVDLESRRKSKEALVERLKKVLAEAKGSVKELMEVEVQMGKTIEEIEAIKGELKYYDNLIGLSTIVLEIVEKDLGQPFEYVQTLQSNIGITAEDAPGAYAAAQKTITEAGGQVADAKLTRQSDGSTQAFVRGRVDAERFPAVREALRKLGHVDTDTVEQQRTARGGQNGASAEAPVRKEQAVIDITVTTPAVVVTRKAQIALETSKAEEAYQAARRAIESAGGKIADGSMTGHTDGATASVRAEIDADKVPALVETLKSLGVVKNASVQHLLPPTAKPGETRLVRERGEITLTIATPPVLIAEGHTLGRTIRDTFSGSYAALMWSIEKLFVGLSLAGPWLVLALGGWLIARRVRRKKPTPPTAA